MALKQSSHRYLTREDASMCIPIVDETRCKFRGLFSSLDTIPTRTANDANESIVDIISGNCNVGGRKENWSEK